jgi:hypothetical protein
MVGSFNDKVAPGQCIPRCFAQILDKEQRRQAIGTISTTVDTISSPRSRMEWYFFSPNTSFAAVREIMTLGGQVQHDKLEEQMQGFYTLIKLIMGLPGGFPEIANI